MIEPNKAATVPSVDDVVSQFVTLVTYDFDLGWICEELNGGEYELTNLDGFGHTDRARRLALAEGMRIADESQGRCKHYYEWPATVNAKHKSYRAMATG